MAHEMTEPAIPILIACYLLLMSTAVPPTFATPSLFTSRFASSCTSVPDEPLGPHVGMPVDDL